MTRISFRFLSILKSFGSRRRALVVLVPAILLLISELVLRFFYYEQLKTRSYPLIYTPDEKLGYRYVANARSRICVPGICKEVQINSAGFTGPEASLQKRPGTLRIVLVEGSDATGIWLNTGDSYARRLEGLLRKRMGAPAIELINLSVDGAFRSRENAEIVRRSVEYAPDLVLFLTEVPFVGEASQRAAYRGYVLVFPRDLAGGLENAKRQIDYIEEQHFLKAMYDVSYTIRAAARLFVRHSRSWRGRYVRAYIERRFQGPTIPRPWSLERSTEILKELRDLVRQHGGRLVLFHRPENELLRAAAQQLGLEFLAVHAYVVGVRERGGSHSSSTGHEAIAEELATKVQPIAMDIANRAGLTFNKSPDPRH